MRRSKELVEAESPEITMELRGEQARLTKALKKEIQGLARYLVEDPLYLLGLKARLLSGHLHPTIEALLFAYAYGKPKERVEVRHASIVRIIHEFAGEEEPKPIEGVVVPQPELPEAEHE